MVGIIGGLGPKAGVHFISSLIERTGAENDQGHINFLMFNHATIPDRSAYILDHSMPNPLPYLIEDVKRLTKEEVSFIVIPCNTAHYFYEQMQVATHVPIIHMIRETVAYIHKHHHNASKVGILATEGTIAGQMYQKALKKAGFTPVVPPGTIQGAVNRLIYDQVKQGKTVDFQLYFDVLDSMKKLNCDTVILGCTELSVIENKAPEHIYRVVDAQEVLVEQTIIRAGKQYVRSPKESTSLTNWRNII